MPLRSVLLAASFVAASIGFTAPAVAPPAPAAGLTVTLVWDAAVDLDLYVTGPSQETFYYANRGTVMGRDARCENGGLAERWERAHWTEPPAGRYRVGVDFPEACGGDHSAVPFRLVIERDGVRRETAGEARLRTRDPAVVEFTQP